ncbi:MAG: hypothetical protein A4E32_01212 [Methanomassiliicoccales archaeon PtaU1.Bin124]|nr:MAG: hypothetical protein A4E32_01212 [Methanomassiliicoccales archaeon PtaU1.Bin124]
MLIFGTECLNYLTPYETGMRWSLLAVRFVIIAISLATTLILLLTVVPLATGGLDIQVPEGQQVQWHMSGDVVEAEVSVNIHNGGYFDIEDFTLSVNMTEMDGTHLATSSSVPTDLKAGKWTTATLPVRIDLNSLTPEQKSDIIFNGTEVKMALGLDSYFGLRFIHLTVNGAGNQTMEIPPMISNLSIDPAQLRLESTGAGYALVQPYSFGASDLVTGKTIQVAVSISNSSAVIGSASQSFTVETYNSGELRVPLSNSTAEELFTHDATLHVDATATLDGMSLSRTVIYEWTAPIHNFGIYNVQLNGYQLAVEYGFMASSQLQGRFVTVDMQITDSVGQIGQGTDSFTISSNNYRYVYMTISPATALRLAGNADDWTITATISADGFTGQIVRTYHWNGGI